MLMTIMFKVEQRSYISYIKGHKITIFKLNYVKIAAAYICLKSLKQRPKCHKEPISKFLFWYQTSRHASERNMEMYIKMRQLLAFQKHKKNFVLW